MVATPIPFSVFDHNQAASEAVGTFQRGMKEVEKVYGARVVDQVRERQEGTGSMRGTQGMQYVEVAFSVLI